MKTRLAFLVLGTLTLWVLVAIPARYVWGDEAAVFAGVGLLLCLLPSAATLAWSNWSLNQTPEQQLVAVVGGMGVRMVVVLGAAWGLWGLVPFFRDDSFWIWVLVSYLLTLALELTLLLAGRAAVRKA